MYRDCYFFTCSKIMRTISTVGILVFDDRYRIHERVCKFFFSLDVLGKGLSCLVFFIN